MAGNSSWDDYLEKKYFGKPLREYTSKELRKKVEEVENNIIKALSNCPPVKPSEELIRVTKELGFVNLALLMEKLKNTEKSNLEACLDLEINVELAKHLIEYAKEKYGYLPTPRYIQLTEAQKHFERERDKIYEPVKECVRRVLTFGEGLLYSLPSPIDKCRAVEIEVEFRNRELLYNIREALNDIRNALKTYIPQELERLKGYLDRLLQEQ